MRYFHSFLFFCIMLTETIILACTSERYIRISNDSLFCNLHWI